MIRTTITYRGALRGEAGATKTEVKEALNEGLENVLFDWHRRTLPVHFEKSAMSRYGYQTRKVGYDAAKWKAKHHQLPLVWSGRLREQVTAPHSFRVVAGRGGARGIITGPRYLYQFRKDASAPDKAAELTAVTEDEAQRFAATVDRSMTRRLNASTGRRVVRID